jgi:hypothetical protein
MIKTIAKTILGSLFAIVLVLPLSAFAEETLQESFTTSTDWEHSYYNHYIVQTFTTTSEYSLSSISLLIFALGGSNNFYFKIYATDNGVRSGSALGVSDSASSGSITTSNTGEWVNLAFDPFVSLSDETIYAIELSCATCDVNNRLSWRTDPNGGYDGGVGYYEVDDQTFDANFKIYSDIEATPTPTASSTTATSTPMTHDEILFVIMIAIVLLSLPFWRFVFSQWTIKK